MTEEIKFRRETDISIAKISTSLDNITKRLDEHSNLFKDMNKNIDNLHSKMFKLISTAFVALFIAVIGYLLKTL